jgi:hypothetical protein
MGKGLGHGQVLFRQMPQSALVGYHIILCGYILGIKRLQRSHCRRKNHLPNSVEPFLLLHLQLCKPLIELQEE